MSVGRRSRSLRSSATRSGTDSTGYDIPHSSLSANPPQLEALPESPPPTLKGSTFAEDFLKAADDIKTKYDSFATTQPCSFNPNFSKTVPIRRRTIKQRLASGSKSLFRSKAQRRGRCQRSDQRSSETTGPETISDTKHSNPKSPNWEPVRSAKQNSEDGISGTHALGQISQGYAAGEQEDTSERRCSESSERRLSQQRCAIYLAATAQEELKAAEDMKRRQIKLGNLVNWSFEQNSAGIPNVSGSSTEESPFLVEPRVSDTDDQQQPSLSTTRMNGSDVSTYKTQIEEFRKAVKSPLVQEMEVPLSEPSIRSLATIELDPLKVDDPDYQGSPTRSRPERSQMTEEAMEETIHDIQEPTSTFTYIPVATTESSDAEDHSKQRAQIEAAISSRRAAANPFSRPLDHYFDGATVSGNHAAARNCSSNFSAASILGDSDRD